MDSINGLNHFSSYISPQHKISLPEKNQSSCSSSVVADGFEHGASGSDSVMNQTDALKFLSSSEQIGKSAAVADNASLTPVCDVEFSLNGIGSSSFFYLEI